MNPNIVLDRLEKTMENMPIESKYKKKIFFEVCESLFNELKSDWPEKYIGYSYKEKPYKILYETKIKIGGTWIEAIVYECLYDNPDGKIWVREKQEFFNLFKQQ